MLDGHFLDALVAIVARKRRVKVDRQHGCKRVLGTLSSIRSVAAKRLVGRRSGRVRGLRSLTVAHDPNGATERHD